MKLSIVASVLWVACSVPAPPAPASSSHPAGSTTSPATAPAPAPDPDAQPLDPDLDALLNRLENNARDLTSFAARIAYEREDALLGRPELRTGEIIYRITGDQKSFAVLFDSRIVGTRREERLYHFIFDGRWLAEIDQENKQFIKREIVPPGKVLDPLKLGEGPFPLPIGQAKADVLARFDVTMIDVPADGLLKSLQNVDGLRLTPKPGTAEAEDYARVEIFYDRATLLPVGINAIESNDDRKTVRLTDPQRNPVIDEAMAAKLDIADPDPREWKIDIRPWVSSE